MIAFFSLLFAFFLYNYALAFFNKNKKHILQKNLYYRLDSDLIFCYYLLMDNSFTFSSVSSFLNVNSFDQKRKYLYILDGSAPLSVIIKNDDYIVRGSIISELDMAFLYVMKNNKQQRVEISRNPDYPDVLFFKSYRDDHDIESISILKRKESLATKNLFDGFMSVLDEPTQEF